MSGNVRSLLLHELDLGRGMSADEMAAAVAVHHDNEGVRALLQHLRNQAGRCDRDARTAAALGQVQKDFHLGAAQSAEEVLMDAMEWIKKGAAGDGGEETAED